MAVFTTIDDKLVPLYRILWISNLPHYCGDSECQREGQYEIHLEQNESVWANKTERDAAVTAVETWLLETISRRKEPKQ